LNLAPPGTNQVYQPSDGDFRFPLSRSDVFVLRNVRFYVLLAGVPGVARDEKLRKQIFEITLRDKAWIGKTLFI
jgi:hypothetical protein